MFGKKPNGAQIRMEKAEISLQMQVRPVDY
jgi:hypothetical protein